MTRMLITGGLGFIGLTLAELLSRDAKCTVVLADNLSRGKLDKAAREILGRPNVELIKADLRDPASFARFGTEFHEVYHLAGRLGVQNVIDDPLLTLQVNVTGTLHLLEWLEGCSPATRLLFSSTSEVYAWGIDQGIVPVPTPESVPLCYPDLSKPRAAYAISKMLGELAVTQAAAKVNRPALIVRFHNVYGPRMGYEHVVPQLYQRIVAGERPLEVSSAEHTRAFCYVSDAIDLCIRALRSLTDETVTLNVGNDNEEIGIGELAVRIAAILDADCPVTFASASAGDPIKRRCPDMSLARRRFGYAPSVSLQQGLERTLEWYQRAATSNADRDAQG